MRRRARTVLCGGRSAMVVPTATVILAGRLLAKHSPRSAVGGLLPDCFSPSRGGTKKDSRKIHFATLRLDVKPCSGFQWIPWTAFHEMYPAQAKECAYRSLKTRPYPCAGLGIRVRMSLISLYRALLDEPSQAIWPWHVAS
jgi:hypothetical protein